MDQTWRVICQLFVLVCLANELRINVDNNCSGEETAKETEAVSLCQHTLTYLLLTTLSLFPSLVRKDIPPSAVTRPICGIMGTIRLVAGKFSWHERVRNSGTKQL